MSVLFFPGIWTEDARERAMPYPTYENALGIASEKEYGVIPICREIYADQTTPIRVLEILKAVSDHCYLFESVEDSARWGRYSYLGYDPSLELTCLDGTLTLTADGISTQTEHADPRPQIRHILAENRSPQLEGLPTFTGGLVGYFSYDYLKYSEPTVQLDAKDEEHFQDVDLMLFDKVIAFDNLRQKILCIVNISTDHLEIAYREAEQTLEAMVRLIQEGTPQPVQPGRLLSEFRPLFDKAAYCAMIEEGKRHIREGDVFQVVLSNRLDADYEGSLMNVYRMLRTTNPSPYLFYLSSHAIEIAGASPETLVKLEDGILHTFPLAGSRPRGASPEEDEELAAALLSDPKELAEHDMLVDLGRNDLGKISSFGSVKVDRYREVLRYSHIMHLGSEVSGHLRSDLSALDAVDAVLPAGTLSGAPKLRAAEIINTLEGNKRGIYGGAIGYLSFTGNLDVCIAIRLVFSKGGRVFVRSGAGIVADSVPENEFQECINKAAAVMEALRYSEEDMAR
jgi:anthranilate synthase component I